MLSCAFITTCIITNDPITANATAIMIPTMVLLLFFFGGGGGDEPDLKNSSTFLYYIVISNALFREIGIIIHLDELGNQKNIIGLLWLLLGWPYRIAAIRAYIIKRSIILGQLNISGFLFFCRNGTNIIIVGDLSAVVC